MIDWNRPNFSNARIFLEVIAAFGLVFLLSYLLNVHFNVIAFFLAVLAVFAILEFALGQTIDKFFQDSASSNSQLQKMAGALPFVILFVLAAVMTYYFS